MVSARDLHRNPAAVDYGGCTLADVRYFPFFECGSGQVPFQIRLKLSGSDYDPVVTGRDEGSITVIPWSPFDDTTVLDWTVVDIFIRAETSGATDTEMNLHYSTAEGEFHNDGDVNDGVVTLGPGQHESNRPSLIAVETLKSGWKVESAWHKLGDGVRGLSVYVVMFSV